MGIIGNLLGNLFGSEKKRAEREARFRSSKRIARKVYRNARNELRTDKKRRRLAKVVHGRLKQVTAQTPTEDLQKLNKHIEVFCKIFKKEIMLNAKVMIGAESLLYQMKEMSIAAIIKEIQDMKTIGLPKVLADELIGHLQTLQVEFQKDLNKIRGITKWEAKGRFQLATVSWRSEKRIEREMKKDARKLRGVIADYETTLRKLHKAENQRDVDKIQDRIDHLITDLENELKFLMEIAEDDVTIMHKLKSDIQDVGMAIQKSNATPEQKNVWTRLVTDVITFEQKYINRLRRQTRYEAAKEGKITQFPGQQRRAA